ncbi:hypothetical protein NQ318_023649 [Aromia moschata]|uniref:HTH psq-type domain-containing protein n=1 Tax=Aromia moschata TaxID=1265417 RepID=A0AAV8YQB0_9CUCU|nr:hypothetical protein NQ318_023649 [Aromia moschata]
MAKRVRKTDEEIQDAVEAVINQNLSIRSVAKDTGISKSLLADLVKKTQKTLQKVTSNIPGGAIGFSPTNNVKNVSWFDNNANQRTCISICCGQLNSYATRME